MAKRTCSIEGCERPLNSWGWCTMHYRRWQEHGSTDDPRPTPNERFWAKVDRQGAGGCWLWTASCNNTGYGMIWRSDHFAVAHRVAYELLVGPIPDGLELDHLCRVRPCVNPDHLEPVTCSENVKRAWPHRRNTGTVAP